MINGADGGEEINVHPLHEELWLAGSSATTVLLQIAVA
jgi:hypothetical protein